MTADFEFIVEESFIVAGGVRVTGQLGRGRLASGEAGRLASGEAGWLQLRPDLAIAVGRIEVERQPQAGPGRAVLVLRDLLVTLVPAGAALRPMAWMGDNGTGRYDRHRCRSY